MPWTLLLQVFGQVHLLYKGCLVSFHYYQFFVEIFELANSADPDLTPRSVASDLGLRFLPMSLLWDAWHKWVKTKPAKPFSKNKCYSNATFMVLYRTHTLELIGLTYSYTCAKQAPTGKPKRDA